MLIVANMFAGYQSCSINADLLSFQILKLTSIYWAPILLRLIMYIYFKIFAIYYYQIDTSTKWPTSKLLIFIIADFTEVGIYQINKDK